jgi:type I restriction enzyme R subunit
MIEFKQIIGRGTRMYDGKEFFTVFDFVKAHHNFADPEWDGEPLSIEKSSEVAPKADFENDTPEAENTAAPEQDEKPEKITIKLSDGKVRQIQHISSVMYWNSDGTPVTAKEFLERMFDDLPQFFENEDQLREIWSDPDTREKLLLDLAEAGYDDEKLDSMKELIDARDSDVYDVLAYVAYAIETRTRLQRVTQSKLVINQHFTEYHQQAFINFILERYINDGVTELSVKKMKSLVELKYNSINDAAIEFGSPKVIREVFVGFQQYLYRD